MLTGHAVTLTYNLQNVARDTSSQHGGHFCKIIVLKSDFK